MTKIYTREVTRCYDCLNSYCSYTMYCSLVPHDTNVFFPTTTLNKEIPDATTIPAWCPLPNKEEAKL